MLCIPSADSRLMTSMSPFDESSRRASMPTIVPGAPAAVALGTIVGMEARREDSSKGDIDVINLLSAEGMQSIHLAQIQRVRFLNAALDSEFKRALEVLASTHDKEKKAV